jgi:hypothetical protein
MAKAAFFSRRLSKIAFPELFVMVLTRVSPLVEGFDSAIFGGNTRARIGAISTPAFLLMVLTPLGNFLVGAHVTLSKNFKGARGGVDQVSWGTKPSKI